MSQIIDARGKACPTPVILAKQTMAAGEAAFSVQVDNRTAVENLKRLAGNQGFDARVREDGGFFTVDFSKNGAPCSACEAEADAPLPAAGRDYAVFVARDIVGDGDRELGTNLMRMFLYTLAQSEELPRYVLFMNAGVRLPTLDEQAAEHVKALEAKGVQVLVCGTCLNFYGLADQLKAGTVSNMYDIVSAMQASSKVITV